MNSTSSTSTHPATCTATAPAMYMHTMHALWQLVLCFDTAGHSFNMSSVLNTISSHHNVFLLTIGCPVVLAPAELVKAGMRAPMSRPVRALLKARSIALSIWPKSGSLFPNRDRAIVDRIVGVCTEKQQSAGCKARVLFQLLYTVVACKTICDCLPYIHAGECCKPPNLLQSSGRRPFSKRPDSTRTRQIYLNKGLDITTIGIDRAPARLACWSRSPQLRSACTAAAGLVGTNSNVAAERSSSTVIYSI